MYRVAKKPRNLKKTWNFKYRIKNLEFKEFQKKTGNPGIFKQKSLKKLDFSTILTC